MIDLDQRSGFVSYMPNNITDINIILREKIDEYERLLAVILTYELSLDETNYDEKLYNLVESNKYFHNFFNSDSELNESKILNFKKFY